MPALDPAAAPRPARRTLLHGTGLLGLLTVAGPLAACGPVRLGSPAPYTPPPLGIDDLYRADLLTVLDRLVAGAEGLVGADLGAAEDPLALAADLDALRAALPLQRLALLTGSEREDEVESASAAEGTTAAPAAATSDPEALIALLDELRSLSTDAARQVSGSLARPVAAIGAHARWAALRLRADAGAGEVTDLPAAEDVAPVRDVPETDPPSVGAEVDYHGTLERAQEDEWYAGYVHEVLAARTADDAREAHLEQAERHRDRAAGLALLAEKDGAPVVPREAVYALPTEPLDEATAGLLPTQVALTLLSAHLALAGAAPFARRPLPLVASLEEAGTLADLVGDLEPVPSLTVPEEDRAATGTD